MTNKKAREVSPENDSLLRRAAERLHHLSLRYGGALVELAQGEGLVLLPQGYPGLKQARDLIDIILLCRAEINGLACCLLDAGVLDANTLSRQFAEEYEWLAQQKAKFLGCQITDQGLVFQVGGDMPPGK